MTLKDDALASYLKHYATRLKHAVALRLLEGKAIENEMEAKALVGFRNAMLDQAVKDQRDGLKVLGETAHAGDGRVLLLAAAQGTKLGLRCEGDDEIAAAAAVEALFADRFGESE
jgi:hypothetical protein